MWGVYKPKKKMLRETYLGIKLHTNLNLTGDSGAQTEGTLDPCVPGVVSTVMVMIKIGNVRIVTKKLLIKKYETLLSENVADVTITGLTLINIGQINRVFTYLFCDVKIVSDVTI